MGKFIELSDEQYAARERTAAPRGQTPQALLDTLIAGGTAERQVYTDLDAFFRALGASEDEIVAAKAIARQELDLPGDDGATGGPHFVSVAKSAR